MRTILHFVFALAVLQLTARSESLQRVYGPVNGTFVLQSSSNPATGSPPWPMDPYNGEFPVYEISPGRYLVEDTPEAYVGLQTLQTSSRMFSMNSIIDPPGDGGGGGGPPGE